MVREHLLVNNDDNEVSSTVLLLPISSLPAFHHYCLLHWSLSLYFMCTLSEYAI